MRCAMDMLTRRRAMMAGIALPEWDVEWNGTDGVLPAAKGFTTTINGSPTVTLLTTSVQLKVKNSTQNVRYDYSSNATIGVFEIDCAIWATQCYANISWPAANNVYFGVRMQHSTNYKGIYLADNSDFASRTKLMSISTDTRYVIKFVVRESDGDIYVNDVIKAQNVPLSSFPMTTTNRGIYVQGASSSTTGTMNVYSMKMKFGRTS